MHDSPDIITASLDDTVVFLTPPKEDGSNQAVRVREDDETNRALKLLGQSIEIVALGRKLVLIEGKESSLDKQTYGAILRDRFPGFVLVPVGGRAVITSFAVLHREVLERTIWGVDFFMLCDHDATPAGNIAMKKDERNCANLVERHDDLRRMMDRTRCRGHCDRVVCWRDWRIADSSSTCCRKDCDHE